MPAVLIYIQYFSGQAVVGVLVLPTSTGLTDLIFMTKYTLCLYTTNKLLSQHILLYTFVATRFIDLIVVIIIMSTTLMGC